MAVASSRPARITRFASGIWRLWEVETGKPLTPPLALGGPIHRAAFSADGRWLLTLRGRWWLYAQPELQLRVWETATASATRMPAGRSLQPAGVLWAAAFA